MHGSPFLHRIECVLAERFALRSLSSGELARDGPCCPREPPSRRPEPPRRRASARAPALAPSPQRCVFG
eukprot:3272532-Pleurochrysis_carterae.AAC.1